MRCTLLLTVASVFASSSAVLLLPRQALPNCAATCLASADYGSCQPTDNACLCKNSAFIQSSTACIEKSCSGSDLTTAEADAQALCAQVGVTLTPPPASGSATAPASSGTGAASGNGTTSAATGATTSSAAAPSATSKSAAGTNNANAVVGAFALGLAALAI
jgi:cell division septation protein DedD